MASGQLQIKHKVRNAEEEAGIISGLTQFVDLLNPRIENGLYQRIRNDYPEMGDTLDDMHINAGLILKAFTEAHEFGERKKDIRPDAIKTSAADGARIAAALASIPARAQTMFDALSRMEAHANDCFETTQTGLNVANAEGFAQTERGAAVRTTMSDEMRPEFKRAFVSDFEFLQAVRDLEQFRTGDMRTNARSMRPQIIDMGKKLAERVQGPLHN